MCLGTFHKIEILPFTHPHVFSNLFDTPLWSTKRVTFPFIVWKKDALKMTAD